MTIESRFWLVDIRIDKIFHLINARFWLVKRLKTPWLDWMNFISVGLNSMSILFFFHVKNNWLRNLLFLFTYIRFLRLFNISFLKIWGILNLPRFLFLLIEIPSLKRNERATCPECGREYTRLHASRHRKHCGVSKCSNCNFYTQTARNLLIISRRSIVNIMLNYVLRNLKTHSSRRQNGYIFNKT